MLGNSLRPAMASFVAVLYTVCIFPTFVTVESKITTVFSNPVKNFPLQNIEFDPQAFYVSAKNVLYKFNQEDFNEELKYKTGPEVGCESGKSCDDHNSVMVVTPTGLVTCSTSHNGRCIRRSKKNFNNISPNVTNIALVSDVDASAVGIFLNISVKNNALYRYKSIILFAKQYSIIQKSLQKLDRSAIFSISPTLSGKDFSAVLREVDIFDFFLKMKSSIMDYRVVIENEEFVFLLVNQDSQAKLVKICKSIEGGAYPKRVYEDIPITCSGTDGTNYTYVVHGTFVSDSEKRYLVALFSTPSSPATSAVCAYSEQEIYTAYLKSRKDRFECPNHDLQDREQIFEGVLSNFNIPKCVNMSEDEQLTGIFHALQNGNFCNDVSAPVFGSIIGLLPLEGTAVYTTTSQVTVIGSTVINDLITLYIGTQNGIVLKVYLDPVGSMSNELERVRLKTSKIKAIKVMKDQTLYFMSEDKIFKYSPEKRCEDFLGNCTSCVMARDSKCGWCIDTQSCTEKANCSRKNFWLPSARNQCLKLELGDERTYLLDLESGLIQMINISFVPVFEIQPEMKCYIDDKPLQRVANNQHLICEINLGDGYFLKSSPGNVSLSVQMNGHILAATDLLLYKCSNYTSCSQCVGGLTSCYWCTKDAKCKRSRGDCTKSEGGDNVTQCPQVDKHIEMIPNGVSRDLEFGAKNLPDNFTYLCHVEGRQYHAEKVGGSLKCKAVKEVYAGKEDIIKRRVQFTYGPANPNVSLETLEGNAELSVYKCENLSPTKKDCSTCQYLKEEQNYECRWCKASGCVVDDSLSDQQCPTAEPCGTPIVTGISPPNGPIGGGTEVSISGYNFGVNKSSRSVLIAGVECKNTKLKSRSITCETGETSPKSGKVTVTVNGQSSTDDVFFIYQEPLIEDIHPYKTIKSGGRTITITGKNLSTGNMNYGVNFIPRNLQGQKKIKCNVDKKISKNGVIVCRPNGANITGFYSLEVTFDGKTIRNFSSQLFEYLKDPEITGTDPSELKSINSGGTSFTVLGKGFTDALETLYVETGNNEESRASCQRKSDEVINCKFPGRAGLNRRRRKRATQATVVIHLDRFTETLSDSVLYVDDPKLDAFQQNQTYAFDPDKHDSILLLGSQLAVVTSKEDYFVLVGSGECAVTSLNNNNLTCRPPSRKPEPRLQEDRLYVRIRVGNLNNVVGIIEYVEDPPIMYIIIGVLGFLLIACLIAGVFIHRRIRTHNQKVIQSMMSEMHELEQNTMQTNQEEFAEMQLNITDIKRDLVSTGIPYHSYQNYSQYMLFPKEVEAGTMLSFLQHSGYSSKNVEKAMDQFEKLMSNKYFVKSLIGTLEKQRKITLIDKAQFSANFSVVMVGKMRDFFDIVNCLLSTLVDSAHKKQHKTLFNRFESITLRLLSHWLSISIYPYLKEGGGSSLFMLYKSTQAVVEKRPVDEVTGEAKNTLSEENFLREKIDCQTMKLEIDLNGNGNLYTCEVLDCDTINQVKSKCLYQIYKNKPASEMPTIDEVDLEWMAGKSGRLTLSNIDQTSERGDGMVRRNTLKHYHVLDGSRMALLYRFSPDDEQEDVYVNQRSPSDVEITIPANVQLIQSVSTTGSLENLRQWHLVKNVEEEESHEKNIKLKDIVKTSHITNLMHTKLVLQDNIKEVFDSVLNHETVPLVVHYLFGVLENLADENGVEPDTLLCWKSESYAMRVWATLLVRPEFLFDIQKVKHVEPCLDVIKQVFIDCFHSTKISKDSSLQKLLFAQEVPHYQKRTEQFYKALANKAAVTDADFWNEMSRLNTLQQEHLKFSKPAALQKLYKFVQQYMEEIIEDLDEGPETSGLQFGKKLDEIIRQMETDS